MESSIRSTRLQSLYRKYRGRHRQSPCARTALVPEDALRAAINTEQDAHQASQNNFNFLLPSYALARDCRIILEVSALDSPPPDIWCRILSPIRGPPTDRHLSIYQSEITERLHQNVHRHQRVQEVIAGLNHIQICDTTYALYL